MEPVRVRFSPDIFRTQRYGGVSRYISELHQGLVGRGVDSRIIAGLHVNSYLRGLMRTTGLDVEWVRPARARQALTKVSDRALERVWCSRLDHRTIWHKSMFDRWVPDGPRLAVTVYDMIHERYPEQFGSRDVIPASKRPWCEAADVVFAISATTRDDLLERFGLPPDKVVVTPLGVTTVQPSPGPLPFDGPPWFLYVGERAKPYKNWSAVLGALMVLGAESQLACFGPSATPAELDLLAARGLTDRVRFVGGDDHDLARLYRAASALVYPSFYEGFGLPPLEAMAQGCPVVAARAGAMPEVLDDAAVFFVPDDVDELADALHQLLADDARVDELRRRGTERAATFTWQRTVDTTLDAYRAVAP
ncbi:MAG TPA: glycosyltransferase family 1 protein [Acidimicrobiia bacterium]|nr:glycosyltransferase family 1 protein [Acidimicrobiia bacterium]